MTFKCHINSVFSASVPRIVSYTTPEGLEEFISDNLATKSGATITYGPFSNLPVTANPEFVEKFQRSITIHYHYEHPVVEVFSLERTAEISHWGANLNIENNVVLHNAGPKYVVSQYTALCALNLLID